MKPEASVSDVHSFISLNDQWKRKAGPFFFGGVGGLTGEWVILKSNTVRGIIVIPPINPLSLIIWALREEFPNRQAAALCSYFSLAGWEMAIVGGHCCSRKHLKQRNSNTEKKKAGLGNKQAPPRLGPWASVSPHCGSRVCWQSLDTRGAFADCFCVCTGSLQAAAMFKTHYT